MNFTARRTRDFWLLALLVGGCTFAWALLKHKLLLYGDATAHMMIARRIVDSATPGLSQWGSVWLPFPHLLAALLIRIPGFWRTGAAGAIVSVISYAASVGFLHALARRHFGGTVAAVAAVVYLLNPNLLYLSAAPMTESVYLAVFVGCIDQISRFVTKAAQTATYPLSHAAAAGLFALAATMTRYDGWFILPFCCLAFFLPLLNGDRSSDPSVETRGATDFESVEREPTTRPTLAAAPSRAKSIRSSLVAVIIFAASASLGPLFWFRYNHYFFRDWLAFARGPYSARQIYLNALRHGGHAYPGDHNLWLACVYYLGCVRVNCGYPLLLLGEAGVLWWLWRWVRARSRRKPHLSLPERTHPIPNPQSLIPVLLWLPLPWYIWAMWSGNVPIFIPQFWPHGYYNVRYGVQLLPALAVFSAALLMSAGITARHRTAVARLALIAIFAGYLFMFRGLGPIAYAEAVYNSPARLGMESKLAAALRSYHRGDRVLMFLGTYPGALADDNIPLAEVIQEGNWGIWDRALADPAAYARWVVLESRTFIDSAVNHQELARDYTEIANFTAPLQNRVTVYRRKW